jgi:signal transduction histidine kinase
MVGGITDITHQRAAADALDRSRRQLRALFAKTQTLREEERTRISREIHDQLGGDLTALKWDLNWIEKQVTKLNDPIARSVLDKAVQATAMTDATITTIQKIATDLRPGALDRLGLAVTLRQEAAAFENRTGVRCQTEVPEQLENFTGETATTVFRIFQETLTNVARHAQATEVQARLTKTAEQLQLQVEDNGKGISRDALANPKSLGLLGMKERAAALGGTIDISPIQPHGTRVTVALPNNRPVASFADMI